ncbi:diamine N-acetyltransferase [Pontibacter ummariensis]|uniref:Diamine N-acetyltransferase n=1 Tax=Pontibacter ummariensis TaxID=1610492 RepID=A0A239B1U8_9BACT|nr:GNAT family N-acetyltransferase [Pontibacter ummariensis]PRY16236.1 diamine N-acetyltransferase [Pontibacter ummariensis]SNS01601.1 diamine N-acetyltransferase [Pontibacter ummariensis]
MFLSSEHIYLRALEPGDLDFLYSLENDATVWHVGNTLTPYSRFVLEAYLQNAALDIYTVKQLRLVICNQHDMAVGAIDLFDFDPMHHRAGVGIVIAADNRNKGYASEALDLLLHYCRNTLQLHQVYCTITATNQASINLFLKAGFEQVGLRKDWLRRPDGWADVVEMQRIF